MLCVRALIVELLRESVDVSKRTISHLSQFYSLFCELTMKNGSSPDRVGKFRMISDRLKHASENLQAHVLLIM